ncbi:MAG: histidine phosphatase family protein [Synergistaceae bacterium]|nr:histidine phosphatase family protein [Synergistaceae bacterium]
MLIFLLRHGKPEFPDDRKYVYGQTDYPLAELGERQARRIGSVLSGIKMDRIISSDLKRAAATADIVASLQKDPLKPERDSGLREINMGVWDGMTKDDIKEGYVDIFRDRGLDLGNVGAPGGETFREVSVRGVATLNRIIEGSAGMERVLIVAHGAIMWGMLCGLFDLSLGDIFRFGLDHCALHMAEYRRVPAEWGQFRLLRYNWSPDLMDYNEDLV